MAHKNDEQIVYAALIIFEKKSTEILFRPLHFVGRHVMTLEYSLWHGGCEHGDKKCEIANNGNACLHVDCGTLSSLMMKY